MYARLLRSLWPSADTSWWHTMSFDAHPVLQLAGSDSMSSSSAVDFPVEKSAFSSHRRDSERQPCGSTPQVPVRKTETAWHGSTPSVPRTPLTARHSIQRPPNSAASIYASFSWWTYPQNPKVLKNVFGFSKRFSQLVSFPLSAATWAMCHFLCAKVAPSSRRHVAQAQPWSYSLAPRAGPHHTRFQTYALSHRSL